MNQAEICFTKDHEWVRLENNIGTIGISDFAQNELGEVVFCELPDVGDEVTKGEEFGTVESVKAVSELYSPLTGEVVEVNEDLGDHPEWVNENAQEKGWMVRVKIQNPNEVEGLMDTAAYGQYIAQKED